MALLAFFLQDRRDILGERDRAVAAESAANAETETTSMRPNAFIDPSYIWPRF